MPGHRDLVDRPGDDRALRDQPKRRPEVFGLARLPGGVEHRQPDSAALVGCQRDALIAEGGAHLLGGFVPGHLAFRFEEQDAGAEGRVREEGPPARSRGEFGSRRKAVQSGGECIRR